MTNRPVAQVDYFPHFAGEALFKPESDHAECSYVGLQVRRQQGCGQLVALC